MAAFAVMAIALLAYWFSSSRPALSFNSRDWILIADFENRTGDPRFDRALLTALTVSLEQSRYANIFPRSRVYETLRRMGKPKNAGEEFTIDESLGREICQRENLRALVEASLTRTGKEYLLTGRLVDPRSGLAARSYSTKVTDEDHLLDALDDMAQRIRRDLGETLYSIRRDGRGLPQVTTPSLTALQAYAGAEELWEKGQYKEAQGQLREALRIDPDFAMAHAGLGTELYSHIFTDPIHGKEEFERALQLSNRVTARERLLIEANFASNEKRTGDALRLYQTYLQAYPDDTHVRFNLANLFLAVNRCQDAIAQYQELIRIDAADVNSRINIATCYSNRRKYAEALPYYTKAFELNPDRLTSANINREYGFALAGAGQTEKARDVFGLGLARPELRAAALRSLGLLDLYEGRYRDAQARLKEAIEQTQNDKSDLGVARNRLYLATAYSGVGDSARALNELQQAEKLDAVYAQAPWLAARIGVALVRAEAQDRAASVLERIRAKTNPSDWETASAADDLEGEVAMARANFPRAIELLQKSRVETYPVSISLSLDGLARAYGKSGQPEKAIAAYESFVSGEGGNPLAWEAQQPWLEAHYELAKLCAARNNPKRAIELLDALLGFWKNADPDLPLLQQAKALRQNLNL
jgi:tetratricopeptide (TPR) repeat protein